MVQDQRPCLVVFSGLPGTGKTTVSQLLADRLRAVYLRIDTIEQAMKCAGAERIGPAGYAAAQALADANLRLRLPVVADCVNPVKASRLGWKDVADRAAARLVNVHLVCSDPAEHRRRVEHRVADIAGHVLPDWDAVTRCIFEPRDDEHLLLDTATASAAELSERCHAYVLGRAAQPGNRFRRDRTT